MKKMIIIILSLTLLTACTNKKEEQKEIMREYAKDYYENFMMGVDGQTKNTISIKALKIANEKAGKNYDLSKLEGCDESSYVNVVVTKEDRKIKKYEYYLNCK